MCPGLEKGGNPRLRLLVARQIVELLGEAGDFFGPLPGQGIVEFLKRNRRDVSEEDFLILRLLFFARCIFRSGYRTAPPGRFLCDLMRCPKSTGAMESVAEQSAEEKAENKNA